MSRRPSPLAAPVLRPAPPCPAPPSRRQVLRAGLLAGAGLIAAPFVSRGRLRLFADDRIEHSLRAVDLVASSTVIDMLGLLTLDWPRLRGWHRDPASLDPGVIRVLRSSGVDVFHPAVDPRSPHPHAAGVSWLQGWNRLIAAHPGELLRVEVSADLDRARRERRIGLVLGFQNSDHFRDASEVAFFHGLGQRVSQLTYNGRNRLGAGCRAERDTGITNYGAEVIRQMDRLGMAIDVSHCAERTCLETFEVSRRPVLVTHSNPRALVDHPRCKSDRVLRAMARGGGVIGITALPAFVRAGGHATLGHLLDHFEYAARLLGVEHVGLGSDSCPEPLDERTGKVRPEYRVEGLDHHRRTYDIVEGLLARGWLPAHVAHVLGGNFRRALAAVWDPPQA